MSAAQQETTPHLTLYFRKSLLKWHANDNLRTMPWKKERDPYKIWLSEVILQQTRVEQGTQYYLDFISTYPTIQDLAAARDEEIYRLWQGLGYYNRCRHLIETARFINRERNGVFPRKYEELLQLKGIGSYTAAAIASFAYDAPHAVVDGNVIRVIARFFTRKDLPNTPTGRRFFQEMAQELLDKDHSADFNQAIMDLGATICKPRNPLCTVCPLSRNCRAFQQGNPLQFPQKVTKSPVRKRYLHYILIKWEDRIWMRQRTSKDIWQNLYEPFLIEHSSEISSPSKLQAYLPTELLNGELTFIRQSYRQLTHQLLDIRFFCLVLKEPVGTWNADGIFVTKEQIDNLALPQEIFHFLKKNFYF